MTATRSVETLIRRSGGHASTTDVALEFGVSDATVRRWARAEGVPRVGATFVFGPAHVKAYAASLEEEEVDEDEDEDEETGEEGEDEEVDDEEEDEETEEEEDDECDDDQDEEELDDEEEVEDD